VADDGTFAVTFTNVLLEAGTGTCSATEYQAKSGK
jgi:hypothetical protein